MDLKEYIGKKEKVRIERLLEDEKYYAGKTINSNLPVYIENDWDYDKEELIGYSFECLIINIINDNLVGFLLTDRKFKNDIKKIEKKLKETGELEEVEDIYLMERLKIKGKVVGLYMVDKGEIGIYYLDTIEIGKYFKNVRGNNIIFKDRKVEDEFGKQIRDVVQSIDLTKKEISLKEEEAGQIDAIQKTLGIDSDIVGLAILDLDQEIEDIEQIREQEQERLKEEQQKQINEELKQLENKPKLSTKKDISIKQETRMKGWVSDYKTLAQVLEKEGKLPKIPGKKFDQMGVVETSEVKNLVTPEGQKKTTNTTKYSFVAIARDGTVVPMNLEQDRQEGRNPMERNYQVNQRGEVEQDDVSSRYKIGQGTFAIKNGQFGEIQIYHSPRKTIGGPGIEGNKSLDRQLESNNVRRMEKRERDLAAEYKSGYRNVQKGYEEAREHEDESGEIIEGDKVKTEDVDGDKNTKTHEHEEINYDLLASKWGYYNNDKPNADKAKELYEEKRKEYPDKDYEEIVEMVTDDLEEQLRNPSGRGKERER